LKVEAKVFQIDQIAGDIDQNRDDTGALM